LEHDGVEIQGRFIDGVFPNFIQVVPENKSGNHFRFSEEFLGLFKELKSTYGNVDFILNTSTKKVRIEGNDELLDFNPDWIEVERGEYPKFGVNLKFLNDFLKIGLFDFSIEDEHSPLHFVNDKYEAVLMPMRLQ
jgi:DNA polymerase III sliding clamp (beta) subunit (PCNA family)